MTYLNLLKTRDYNELVLVSLEIGDMIKFTGVDYSHWGIFVGHGTISHLVGVDDCNVEVNAYPVQQFYIGCKKFNKAKVCIDEFWDVVGENKAFVDNASRNTPFERMKIVKRATETLGYVQSNMKYSSCKNFATWCRYGVEETRQDKTIAPVTILIGVISLCIGVIYDITSRKYIGKLIALMYEHSALCAGFSLCIIYPIVVYLVYHSKRNSMPTKPGVNQAHGQYTPSVSKDGGIYLLRQLLRCEVNPGHSKFIPVKKFTLKHLPAFHRDKDLYELIKCTADLTVRVAVKMTSPHRPDVWAGTNVTYPFNAVRGKTSLRTGSGILRCQGGKFIDGCDQFRCQWKKNRHCWCLKCQHSDSPNRVWWEFNALTAAHVVFDDIEAAHTSLRLFYDDNNSPLVSLDHVKVVYVDIMSDISVLKCVTCDETLAGRLNLMWDNFNRARGKVSEKDKRLKSVNTLKFMFTPPRGCSEIISIEEFSNNLEKDKRFLLKRFGYTVSQSRGYSKMVAIDERNKYEKDKILKSFDRLSFLVSHPHGCSKMVSIGHWVDKLLEEGDLLTISYTTCACPGSAGGPVYCMGYFNEQLIHSSSFRSGLNHSGGCSLY